MGISLVLITEYFDIKGAKILRLGYMTTLIYGGIILVSGYKFIYGKTGILTTLFAKIIPGFPIDWFEGFWAVLFVMTFACTSNHMIFLRNAMRAVDFQTVEAAQNMGASQFRILTKVVLPVLTPSLLAVTILTFITGLSATSAPLLVGGQEFQTITPMILTFSGNVSSRPLAALLALFLGVATILLLTVMIQIEKRGHYMSISKVKTTIIKQKIRNPILNVLVHIYAYVLFLIYVIPVVLVVLFSFTDAATIASKKLTLSSFTLDNYISIFQKATSYKPFVVSICYSGHCCAAGSGDRAGGLPHHPKAEGPSGQCAGIRPADPLAASHHLDGAGSHHHLQHPAFLDAESGADGHLGHYADRLYDHQDPLYPAYDQGGIFCTG